MDEIIKDIQEKLRNNYYLNEEHVRLSLVARILQSLGWDIWNPKETNCEFIVAPHEDKTRVDIALFDAFKNPCVFIEIKAVGTLNDRIDHIERQLRDYNRNLTALFCVITDGNIWRFYYSQTGGEFSQKCFRKINILEDQIDEVELNFYAFLSKEEIINGQAKKEAKNYLRLSQKQKLMSSRLTKARQKVDSPPYPSLPDALIELMRESDFQITKEEAVKFIKENYRRDELGRTTSKQEVSSNREAKGRSYDKTKIYEYVVHNAHARLIIDSGLYVILKGSTALMDNKKSMPSNPKKTKQKLIQQGKLIIKSNEQLYEFTDNVPFNSPSLASCIVSGTSTNGKLCFNIG